MNIGQGRNTPIRSSPQRTLPRPEMVAARDTLLLCASLMGAASAWMMAVPDARGRVNRPASAAASRLPTVPLMSSDGLSAEFQARMCSHVPCACHRWRGSFCAPPARSCSAFHSRQFANLAPTPALLLGLRCAAPAAPAVCLRVCVAAAGEPALGHSLRPPLRGDAGAADRSLLRSHIQLRTERRGRLYAAGKALGPWARTLCAYVVCTVQTRRDPWAHACMCTVCTLPAESRADAGAGTRHRACSHSTAPHRLCSHSTAPPPLSAASAHMPPRLHTCHRPSSHATARLSPPRLPTRHRLCPVSAAGSGHGRQHASRDVRAGLRAARGGESLRDAAAGAGVRHAHSHRVGRGPGTRRSHCGRSACSSNSRSSSPRRSECGCSDWQ